MEPETVLNENPQSPIQQFYAGRSILITGATGFLGRILLEKLLRSCRDIKKIYLLIRPKNEDDVEQRLKKLVEDSLFDLVRKEQADFQSKIVAISGDCTVPDLGLKEEDVNTLCDEVSLVFHVASTVEPLEALSVATVTNVFGTFELLKLAASLRRLECFLYVSCAFSFYPLKVIKERVYEGMHQPREFLSLLEFDNANEKFDALEEGVLKWSPNAVCFTKGLAENLVQEYAQRIPVAIFRPSLISSTYKEPYVNYVKNLNGPAGIVFSALRGILRSLSCDPNGVANLVPADMCANCMITIPWEISKSYQPPKCPVKDCIPVYNFESSSNQPITWKNFIEKAIKSGLKYPPSDAFWCYSLKLRNNPVIHYFSLITQHFIPATFCDTFLFLIGQHPGYWQALINIFFLAKSMEFVTKNNSIFISKNVSFLLRKMSDLDKKLFNFDLQTLHWDEYLKSYSLGIRLWALKDPMSTVQEARRRYRRFQLLDKVTTFILVVTALYVFFNIITYFIIPDFD